MNLLLINFNLINGFFICIYSLFLPVPTSIKLEGGGVTIVEAQDGVTDIQNYLETFNKEIQGGETQVVQQVGGRLDSTDFIFFVFVFYCENNCCNIYSRISVVSHII